MVEEQIDISTFSKRPDAVALVLAGQDLFGFLTRSLTLPPRWIALVTRENGDVRVSGPGGPVSGEGVTEIMFARVDAMELLFRYAGISSADGYLCRVTVVLDVHVVAEKSELTSFRKTVLGARREATAKTLAQLLHWPLRQAVVAYAGEHPAAVLVDGKRREAFGKALEDKTSAVCFASGLAVERCGALQAESSGWQAVRETAESIQAEKAKMAARQQLREARATAQHEHLKHVEQLIGRLEKMAVQKPDVRLGDLIRTFSEQERAELYETLWSSETPEQRTAWVAAAAGKELLFYEPGLWKQYAKRLSLSGAGPLRSVQVSRREGTVYLLAGAARGVYVVDVTDPEKYETYLFEEDQEQAIRGGVNAATFVGHHLLATHSAVGLLQWESGDHIAAPKLIPELTEPAHAVRGIQQFDRDVWLSVDDGVLRFPDGILMSQSAVIYTGSHGRITALCAHEEGVFAGNDRGDVLRWTPSEPDEPTIVHRGHGQPTETVGLRTTGGVSRLLYTDCGDALFVKVLGDTFSCAYDGGGQVVRRVELADDLFVGLNQERDRVLCWLPHQPAEPAAILPLARQTGNRVQDVCLVPEA